MLEEILATNENSQEFLLKTIKSVRCGNLSQSIWGTSGNIIYFLIINAFFSIHKNYFKFNYKCFIKTNFFIVLF